MNHIHNLDCIETDVMDMGDDGDGYQAFDYYICKVTGESHRHMSDFGGGLNG